MYLEKALNSTTINNLNSGIVYDFEIPVPPLPVQEEIVKILDRFAEYAAELQAELQARKEQYEYYRNQLLSFTASATQDDTTEDSSVTDWGGHSYKVYWKTMGEIGTFIRGNGLQKKDFTESGVGCIHYGQIYTYYGTFTDKTKSYVTEDLAKKLLQVYPGNLVIACTSENVEDVGKSVAWLGNSEIVTGGHSVVFRHNQNPKYIAYFFQTESFFVQKRKYAVGTKVIDIKTEDLAKIIIPIPPLEVQEKIVSILDRFETLVNDLTEGLPAEIEARRAQYEYYRNSLLSFPRIA
jgi:type I restriction enzyme S subunit